MLGGNANAHVVVEGHRVATGRVNGEQGQEKWGACEGLKRQAVRRASRDMGRGLVRFGFMIITAFRKLTASLVRCA